MNNIAWNDEYLRGRWNCLHDLEEVEHYAILAALVHHLGASKSILDIACGEGILQSYLKVWNYGRYLGIDAAEAAIEKARGRRDAVTEFITANAETFEPRAKFSCILFCECLYYFSNPVGIIERYSRWLEDGGIVVISVWQPHAGKLSPMSPNLSVLRCTTVTNSRGSWECVIVTPK